MRWQPYSAVTARKSVEEPENDSLGSGIVVVEVERVQE